MVISNEIFNELWYMSQIEYCVAIKISIIWANLEGLSEVLLNEERTVYIRYFLIHSILAWWCGSKCWSTCLAHSSAPHVPWHQAGGDLRVLLGMNQIFPLWAPKIYPVVTKKLRWAYYVAYELCVHIALFTAATLQKTFWKVVFGNIDNKTPGSYMWKCKKSRFKM